MAAMIFSEMPWHEGEKQMQAWMRVTEQDNATVPQLSSGAARMLERSPLLAVGTVDIYGHIWSTIWGGAAGFARGLSQSHLALKVTVDLHNDPVVQALLGLHGSSQGMVEEVQGKMLAGLAIDLETRRRVKLFGRTVAGAIATSDDVELQLLVKIEQSLGNCPKYLNSKHIYPSTAQPKLLSDSATLGPDALSLLDKVDCFYISSANKDVDMDTNYRGGAPGFVRHQKSSEGLESQLVWPEFSGNRMYQTLGNLVAHPFAGLVFPDFETGNVLYVSGTTEILVGRRAATQILRSNLAVVLTIKAARFVQQGLFFRATALEPSPYNPKIRRLASEQTSEGLADEKSQIVRLIKRTSITPDIACFTFAFTDRPTAIRPKPGQWVALDFSSELDEGYSHMRDDSPTSLNDDYVRTFTVSSAPLHSTTHFDITIRNVGRVTKFMFDRQRLSDMEFVARGFGGNFVIDLPQMGWVGFLAGGIGITPLMALADTMDTSRLRLFWTLQAKDLPLVLHFFALNPSFAGRASILVTGTDSESRQAGDVEALIQQIVDFGAALHRRRLEVGDLVSDKDQNIEKWYVCTSPSLRKAVLEWLPEKEVIYEDFSY